MFISTYRAFTRIFLSYNLWQKNLREWKKSHERDISAHNRLHYWGDEFFVIVDLLGFDLIEQRNAFITILKSLFRHYKDKVDYLEDILSMDECESIVDFCLRKEND